MSIHTNTDTQTQTHKNKLNWFDRKIHTYTQTQTNIQTNKDTDKITHTKQTYKPINKIIILT